MDGQSGRNCLTLCQTERVDHSKHIAIAVRTGHENAGQGGFLGLTRAWARELSPRILVNAVAPGPTDTPLLAYDSMTAEQKALENNNPMGRIGKPEEVAAAVVFLAGPTATFFTGQCLGANGGAAMT